MVNDVQMNEENVDKKEMLPLLFPKELIDPTGHQLET